MDTILFKSGDLEVSRDDEGNYRTVGDTRKIACEAASLAYDLREFIDRFREELRLMRSHADELGYYFLSVTERYKIEMLDEITAKLDEEIAFVDIFKDQLP